MRSGSSLERGVWGGFGEPGKDDLRARSRSRKMRVHDYLIIPDKGDSIAVADDEQVITQVLRRFREL